MSNLLELKRKREQLQDKLDNLSKNISYVDHEIKNNDSYARNYDGPIGSEKEIRTIKEQIRSIDKEIEQAEFDEKKRQEERKSELEKNEIEKKKAKEQEKIELEKEKERQERLAKIEKNKQKKYFKQIKARYRKGPFLERLLNSLIVVRNGRPKWSKVKNYTSEELEFLVKLGAGNTLQQKEEYKGDFSSLKVKRESYWYDFASALGSKYRLKKSLEKEEELEKNQRGLY